MKYTIPQSFQLSGGNVISNNAGNNLMMSISDNNNKRPLILVYGKEINADEMNKIDPSSIEGVTILKDEQAVKKYGDKGKDGVVEITLKK